MAKKETLDVVETVLDTVEDQIETIERIPKLHLNGTTRTQQIVILSVTATVGALVGAGVTYILAKKHFKTHYEEIAMREIAEAKEFYGRLNKNDSNYDSPEKVLERLHGKEAVDALRRYQGAEAVEAPVDTEADLILGPMGPSGADEVTRETVNEIVEEKIKNVFESNSTEFDYDAEVALRSDDKPYIITHDEYFAGEKDYEMISLTYFEEDDVLVDASDDVVPDPESTVGDDHLVRFGYGSNDKNVVYIRNESLEIDFEITRSSGSYAKEVLGFTEPELRHSDRGMRKFRHDD